jgi:hypothetical protein
VINNGGAESALAAQVAALAGVYSRLAQSAREA